MHWRLEKSEAGVSKSSRFQPHTLGTSGRGDRRGQDNPTTPPGLRRPAAPHRAGWEAPWACPERGEGGSRRRGPLWEGAPGSLGRCRSGAQAAQLCTQAWARAASPPRSNFSTQRRSRPGTRTPALRAPAHPVYPFLPLSQLLSTPLPFILTLLGRRVEVASWTARAAMLKSSEAELGRASRRALWQRRPAALC